MTKRKRIKVPRHAKRAERKALQKRKRLQESKKFGLSEKEAKKNAKARWMGKMYSAKLSFRYGKGGRKIPVYSFKV